MDRETESVRCKLFCDFVRKGTHVHAAAGTNAECCNGVRDVFFGKSELLPVFANVTAAKIVPESLSGIFDGRNSVHLFDCCFCELCSRHCSHAEKLHLIQWCGLCRDLNFIESPLTCPSM